MLHTHTHTHADTHRYLCICMCVCVLKRICVKNIEFVFYPLCRSLYTNIYHNSNRTTSVMNCNNYIFSMYFQLDNIFDLLASSHNLWWPFPIVFVSIHQLMCSTDNILYFPKSLKGMLCKIWLSNKPLHL